MPEENMDGNEDKQPERQEGAEGEGPEQEGGGASMLNDMFATSNIMSACEATNATRPKRHRTEEEKREERLAANRRSARDSRNRKKLVFDELQRSVARLAEENAALRRENEKIKSDMAALRRQFGLGDGAGVGGAAAPQQQAAGQVDNAGGAGLDQQQALQQQLALFQASQMGQHQPLTQQQQILLAAAVGQGTPNESQATNYQDRLNLFQRRVDERAQLIEQLKNSMTPGADFTQRAGAEGTDKTITH